MNRIRDSSVGIAMGYCLEGWGLASSRDRKCFHSTVSRSALGPILPPMQWTLRDISPGAKQKRHGAEQSTPSNAEVKNSGAIPSLLISFHGAVLKIVRSGTILMLPFS
jgi:hypothetical protein